MDLTRLTHYLVIRGVQNVIDEPIGFDGLKTTIKRGDYHGVSAEVSAGTLEFYDSTQHNAATIIRNAYNEDIETEITYYVADETHTTIYKGVIDLSTYAETKGNSTKIACKVGEVGVKTMFNVRTETEVDLNATQTIDGKALSFDPTWLNLNVPRKHLRYTNLFRQTYTQTITKDDKNNELRLISGSKQNFVAFPITKVVSKEFGETSVGNAIVYAYSNVFHYDDNPLKYLYQTGDVEKFNAEFGVGARCKMTCNIKMHVEIIDPIFNNVEDNVTISCGVGFGNAGKMIESQNYYDGQYNSLLSNVGKRIKFVQGETKTIDIEYENKIGLEMRADNINLWGLVFAFEIRSDRYQFQNNARIKVTIDRGTEFKMVLTDELEEDNVFVDMLPVHESLNKIAGIISENQLSVRSDWFGRPDSQIEPTYLFGGGSLKALTNGYKIRDLYTDEENKRSMQVSFKKAIQALNVLDCVGWGFSLEDGQIVVRVERWDWFYKNDVVLVINDPNEVKRRISTDNIFNEIVIGYKKYKTSNEYNSIDSVFGERVFTSALKSVANKKTLTCEFVADNYAIEETRRARNEKNETEETSYDESIFVFELSCVADWHDIESELPPDITDYEVVNNVTSASGVARASEQLNVQLSPRRCAERWRNFLFATNNQLPYKFTSGKINCDASFQCKQYDYPNPQSIFVVKHFLEDFAHEMSLPENEIMEFIKTKFKSEIVEFTYPIAISQFNALRDNPYGIIIVNGEKCWLKEVTLKISTGECQFKVIPMNE